MHDTTFQYLKSLTHLDDIAAFGRENGLGVLKVSQRDFSFGGEPIATDNFLRPTIDEPEGWMFPENEPFVEYGPEDEEMCRYFGWGRQGRGFVLGEILQIDESKIKPFIDKFNGMLEQDLFNQELFEQKPNFLWGM